MPLFRDRVDAGFGLVDFKMRVRVCTCRLYDTRAQYSQSTK
jgi:hypothetical protein